MSCRQSAVGQKIVGSSGRIVRGCAANPPLRSGPPPRNASASNLACGQVVEPVLFHVGGSNCGRYECHAENRLWGRKLLAPRDGFEPPTNGLTVRRSTTELPGNSEEARIVRNARG